MIKYVNLILTLLFINALRHWISLCWFFLSILSCLERKEENHIRKILTTSPSLPPFKWSRSLLFLVQKLFQCIQQEPKTFMPKIVNPAGKKKTEKKAFNDFLIKCRTCKAISLLLLVHPFTGSTLGLTSQKIWSATKANSSNKSKLLKATEKGEEMLQTAANISLLTSRVLRTLLSCQQALA